MRKKTICIAVVSILFACLCGCGKTANPTTVAPEKAVASKEDAKGLYEQSCTVCHGTARIEEYDRSQPWKDIVTRMIDQHGAKISAENASRIIAYLDKTHPGK
jgi:mono/diheme cytochrome c family protein